MKKIILILSILFSIGVVAQETAKKALLDIEQHAFHKKFSKKWEKEKKSNWEKAVQEANNIEDLNKLFNEFSDLFAQSTSFSMGNSSATNEVELVKYLMEVEVVLSEDFTNGWSVEDRIKWKGELEKYLVLQEEKKKKEDQMARFQKMTGIVKDFTDKFPSIWEDSKKNAFGSSKEITLKGGSEIEVVKDEYGVASFVVFFDTEGDDKMTNKLMEEFILVIESNVGEGYKQGNDMDPAYTGSMKKNYQFEGAKFAETAKKPTVAVGTLKDKSGVKVVITEPVFGH